MEERWKVKNDKDAEWIIEKTQEDLVEIKRFKESLKNKMNDIQEKLTKLQNEEDRVVERRDSYLLEYFETIPEELKKKTKTQEKYRLPSGEIVKKYPNPKIERDEEKLLSWAKANAPEYVEVKESTKWGELKKATTTVGNQVVTGTGEIVDGVRVIERAPVIEFKEV